MTKEKMQEETQILFDAFTLHSREAREGKLRAIYQFFGSEDAIVLEEACRALVASETHFPSISCLGAAIREAKRKKQAENPHTPGDSRCYYCGGDGVVSAIRDSDGSRFTFRCHCDGASRYQKIPAWFGVSHPGYTLLCTDHTYAHRQQSPELYQQENDDCPF